MRKTGRINAGLLLLLTGLLVGGVLAASAQVVALTNQTQLTAEEMAKLTNDFKIHLWNMTANLRGTFGFKDNVTLSNTNKHNAAFWNTGGDVLAYRLPTGPWFFNLIASADDTHYFGGGNVNNEQTVIVASQLVRNFADNWSGGFGASYMFQNQVMDLSTLTTNQAAVGQILGHNFTGRLFGRKDFKVYWLQLELPGSRQFLKEPLDSYWQVSPRLTLGRHYGQGSEVTLSYQESTLLFDNRETTDSRGVPIPGTSMRFETHTGEVGWHHVWDKLDHWHTWLAAGVDANHDNGGGYYDYNYYRVTPRFEYHAPTWKCIAWFRFGYYDYPVQTISPTSVDLRMKTDVAGSVRVEKNLRKTFKLFAQFDYEHSLSNFASDRYDTSTASLGFDWQFLH